MATQSPQWWTKYPAAKAKCAELDALELMGLFDDMDREDVGGRKFLCVDVRRDDWLVSCFFPFE
jgi:hypothetical protein